MGYRGILEGFNFKARIPAGKLIAVNDEARDNLLAMGYRTTPVVTVGKDVIVGYSVMRLAAVLEENII